MEREDVDAQVRRRTVPAESLLRLASLRGMTLLEKVTKAERVFIIGNGGSWANAVHIANDLLATGVAAFTLDAATLTATANDFSYEEVFSRWLRVVASPKDLLIALSGSGVSRNIVRAMAEAERIGMASHLVTHYLRGRTMQESEEDQLVIGHELRAALMTYRQCS